MSRLPLDVQRRHERRWAARFSDPVKPVASRKQKLERETEQIAEPERAEEKPAVEPMGLMPVSERGTEAPCRQPLEQRRFRKDLQILR